MCVAERFLLKADEKSTKFNLKPWNIFQLKVKELNLAGKKWKSNENTNKANKLAKRM